MFGKETGHSVHSMKIREFYKAIGGDYDDMFRRMPSDSMIEMFLLKFPADPSYAALAAARESRDTEGAFLAAHTLKGVASTLGLKELTEAAALLVNALRPPSPLPGDALFDKVDRAYGRVLEQIAALLR